MRYLITTYIIFLCLSANGQQEPHFTQFTGIKSAYNPAFVNEGESFKLTGLFRSQWAGLDGAPSTQILNGNFPLPQHQIGLGFHIQRSSIGIQEKLDFNGMYAYKLKIGDHSASLGLQLSLRRFVNDFTDDRLIAIDGLDQDPVVSRSKFSKTILNAGLGGRIQFFRSYIGLSAPRLIKSKIDEEENGFISRESRHVYLIAGTALNLTDLWEFQPHLLYKYAEKSPDGLEVFTNFIYRNQIHMGTNFRLGGYSNTVLESADIILGLQVNEKLFASMAFDFTFTELRDHENGSFELLISYNLNPRVVPVPTQNPRYF